MRRNNWLLRKAGIAKNYIIGILLFFLFTIAFSRIIARIAINKLRGSNEIKAV